MLFNSRIFLALLVLVLAVYYVLPERWRIGFLLAVSIVFYGWWDPQLCLLLFCCIGFNFWLGARMHAARGDAARGRRLVWLCVIANIGVLGFFKYTDFFIEEFCLLASLAGVNIDPQDHLLRLVLPVGISFYTFQTMSYPLDIYRGEIVEPERSLTRFALYVTFFPQLVAGPVERAPHLLPQFSRPFRLDRRMVYEGVFLVLLGFAKKVIIADRLGAWIAPFYRATETTAAEAAASMLLFTTQIYVDFSSYSDIAIGLGLLLGYSIRPNFNLPFVVPSIPERWRRWHLSMSEWFRDYIFIPLGGSKKGVVRTQINVLIVMLASGLWHGASNNFLVWGLLNGLTMVGHRLLLRPLRVVSGLMDRHPVTRIGYFYLCCFVTYCTIASINIFFRCPDWETAKRYVRIIFLSGWQTWVETARNLGDFPPDLVNGFAWTLVVFVLHESQRWLDAKRHIRDRRWLWVATCLLLFWGVVTFGVSGSQFIYYQF